MAEYTDLDLEVIKNMKEECIQEVKANAVDDLYYFIVEHKHGKGARDPMIPVDWDLVFKENQCPECKDIISLRELTYVCDKCGLKIPVRMYDLASEEYSSWVKIHDDGVSLAERMRKAGYSDERTTALYEDAERQAFREIESLKTEDAGKSRRGARIGPSSRGRGGES